MNGQDFINQIFEDLDKVDVQSTDTTYRAIVLNWLNRVLKNIATMQDGFHWRFLEKTATFETVEDQHSYDLPSDIDGYKVFDVRQKEDDIKIEYRTQQWFDENFPDPTVTGGNAYYYTLWASAIKLLPIPSSAFDVYMRYIKTPTALTDDSDSTTDVPSKWDDVIIQGVLAKAYKMERRLQDSLDAKNDFLAGIERMKSDNETIIDYNHVADSHRIVRSRGLRFKTPAGVGY